MDFWQFFTRPEELDVDKLKEFFKKYNLNTNLIDLSLVEQKIDESNFTFFTNEKFGLEKLDYSEAHMFFDEFDDNKNENGYGKDGIEFEEMLKKANISSNEKIYKLYFKLSGGGNIDTNNTIISLSDNDVALYTYVYALYLSKYYNGILYYSNDAVYVTDDTLNKLIKKGLEGKIINGGVNIINKKYVNYLIDVIIEQKYLFKRKLNYKDIIKLSNSACGIKDEFDLLIENKVGTHTLIYDRNNLGRGIDLSILGKNIILSLSIPTSSSEIRRFYEIIDQICRTLKIDNYIRKYERVNQQDKEKFIEQDEKLSIQALQDLEESILQGESKFGVINGIYNPISLGINEIKQIDNNLEKFDNYLHNLQSFEVFYPRPKVYENNNSGKLICCFFIIGPDIPTVLRINAFDGLKIDEYYIVINDKRIKYEDFMNNVKKKDYYDADHVVVVLTDNEMEDLVKTYAIDK